MAEKEKDEKKGAPKKAKKKSAGARKPTANKAPAGEEEAAAGKPEKTAEKPTVEEEVKPSSDEEPTEVKGEEESPPGPQEEEAMSEEEFRRLVEERLYLPEYRENPDYRTFDGFSLHFVHPHFTPPELEALQRELYRRDFERLGPSLVRMVRVWFEGYKNLRGDPNSLLRKRAERMGSLVRSSLPALYPAILFGPNRDRRRSSS